MTPELERALYRLKMAIFELGVKIPDRQNPRIVEVLFSPQVRVVVELFRELVEQIQKEDRDNDR